MTEKIVPRSLGTHNGWFHADEITACALLLHFDLIDRDRIVRTRDLERLDTCEFVCDVGGVYDPKIKRFDHHQADYNGDMSSAGMILKYLRDENTIDEELYQYFRDYFVSGVDAHDIGAIEPTKGICTFSLIIQNFKPAEYDADLEQKEQDFYTALGFTLDFIKRAKEHFLYQIQCRDIVKKSMDEGSDLLIFETSIPWVENFFHLGGETHPATFLIMPTGTHWKLRGIPPNLDERMKVREPLPEEWSGKIDEDLKKASGIEGAIFCHKGRFISIWETKEDALQAYQYIQKKRGK